MMPTGGGSAQMNAAVNAPTHNAKQTTIGLFDDIHGWVIWEKTLFFNLFRSYQIYVKILFIYPMKTSKLLLV